MRTGTEVHMASGHSEGQNVAMALLEINDQESWGLGREITSQLLSTIRWQTGKIRYIRRKQIQRWLRQCSVFHPHNVNYAEVPGKAP